MINSAGPEQPLKIGFFTWLAALLFLLSSETNIVGALLLWGSEVGPRKGTKMKSRVRLLCQFFTQWIITLHPWNSTAHKGGGPSQGPRAKIQGNTGLCIFLACIFCMHSLGT